MVPSAVAIRISGSPRDTIESGDENSQLAREAVTNRGVSVPVTGAPSLPPSDSALASASDEPKGPASNEPAEPWQAATATDSRPIQDQAMAQIPRVNPTDSPQVFMASPNVPPKQASGHLARPASEVMARVSSSRRRGAWYRQTTPIVGSSASRSPPPMRV